MRIDDEVLDKLQKLGMLKIEESKREEVKNQISEILGFVENLSNVQTDHVNSQGDLKTPMREDVPVDFPNRDEVLKHAPKTQDGYFVVPKIIE